MKFSWFMSGERCRTLFILSLLHDNVKVLFAAFGSFLSPSGPALSDSFCILPCPSSSVKPLFAFFSTFFKIFFFSSFFNDLLLVLPHQNWHASCCNIKTLLSFPYIRPQEFHREKQYKRLKQPQEHKLDQIDKKNK